MAKRKTTTRKPSAANKPKTTTVARTNGNIRIVEPQRTKKRRASKPKVVTLVAQTDDVLMEKVGGFADFIREYAVVALAVGFIVGQQANAVIKQLVASFVDPVIQVWFGESLSSRTAYLHHGSKPVAFPWGQFLVTLLNFILILLTVYIVIKFLKLDRLKKIEDEKDDAKDKKKK